MIPVSTTRVRIKECEDYEHNKKYQTYKAIRQELGKAHTGELYPASFSGIEDMCRIASPSNILEIGFNAGNSSLMWLLISDANVVSVDIKENKKSFAVLSDKFPDRFSFILEDSKKLYTASDFKEFRDGYFDFVFIDGDHSKEAIISDTELAIKVGSKYIAYDDYIYGPHAEDTREAISHFGLEIVSEYDLGAGQVLTKV